jgi:hypothetical protein
MATSIDKNSNVQLRATTSRLNNRFELTVTGGIWCPECGDDIRACDAEGLDDDGRMRLVCRCGHLILEHELRL